MKKPQEDDPARPTLIAAMLPRMSDDQLCRILDDVKNEMRRRGPPDEGQALASLGGDQFVEDVGYMRAAQKEYFALVGAGKRGTIEAAQVLNRSKGLESKVDKALAAGAARRQAKMEL